MQLTHVADGALWATTTTDGNGLYAFPGLIDGLYTVRFVAPAGYVFTAPNLGDDLGDSDADPATGVYDSFRSRLMASARPTRTAWTPACIARSGSATSCGRTLTAMAYRTQASRASPRATVTVTWLLDPTGVAGGGDDQTVPAPHRR